eukprot:Nitzschia sp. Nitz4//scaffold129_size63868//13638//14333//NITZ4_006195-RA/size63868-processed-gene-0.66-mRNA-1//-1//CDS//3329534893//113//frame0
MGSSQSSTAAAKQKAAVKQRNQQSISAVDRAMLDLKNARDRLSKYQTQLQRDETQLVERARQAKQQGKTQRALQLLKIKKIKTTEVQQVEAQLLNVLQMVQTMDSKQNEAQVLKAMAQGKDALHKMHQETTVEDVLDLMDQIREEAEVEQEINGILSNAPELSPEDEVAVEAELEALMMQEGLVSNTTTTNDLQLPEVPTGTPLPKVPTTQLPDPTAVAAATEEKRIALPS